MVGIRLPAALGHFLVNLVGLLTSRKATPRAETRGTQTQPLLFFSVLQAGRE